MLRRSLSLKRAPRGNFVFETSRPMPDLEHAGVDHEDADLGAAA